MITKTEITIKKGQKKNSMYLPDTVVSEASAEDDAYFYATIEGLKTRKTEKKAHNRKPSSMDFEELFDAYPLTIEI